MLKHRAMCIVTVVALLAGVLGLADPAGASGNPPYTGYDYAYDVGAEPVVIDVLANDTDEEGDPLSVVPSSGTTDQGGSLECDTTQCTYTATDPLPETESDSFTYTVSDGESTAEGYGSIYFVAHLPVAGYDQTFVSGPDPIEIDVLANDYSPTGKTLSVVPSESSSSNDGQVSCSTTSCTYTPPIPLPQTDYFQYEITDGTYTVIGNVDVQSSVPFAYDDDTNYTGGTSLSVNVLANDSSPVGNPLSVVPQTGTETAQGGTVDCDAAGCTYYPPVPMPEVDTFTYEATDGTLVSNEATVTVHNVVCADPTGSLNDDSIIAAYTWVACTGSTSNGPVTGFTPLMPSTGASSFLMTNGTLEAAEPPNDESGATGYPMASNSYRGANDVQVLELDLNVPAGTTCLAFDFVFGSEEYPEYVGSSFNDAFLAELDSHTWNVSGSDITAPDNFAFDSGGDQVSINSTFFDPERVITETGMQYDGSTPRLRAQTPITPGAHTLYLTVFDAGDHSLDSGALIDNLRVEAAPEGGCQSGASVQIAVDDTLTTPEDTAAPVDVTANDLFADSASPSVLLATQPAHGTAACTSAGICTYTPDPDFNGTDSFTYLVQDGLGASDNGTVHVTVIPVNDNPVAVDDAIGTDQGVAGSVDVLTNDTDVDLDALSVSAFTQGAHGTVSCAAGTCTYTPNAGFSGSDSFTYTVSDGHGGTATATVAVTVNPAINHAPIASDEVLVTNEDVAGGTNVLANDTDDDGDTLVITSFTQGAHGVVSCSGASCTYTPAPDFNGSDSFTYTVADGNGGADTATVSVTVNPVNDAPVAVDDTLVTDEDVAGTLNLVGNDTDIDGDTLTVSANSQGAHGTVSCSGGSCTYTPAADFNGTDSFTYTVADGHGGTDTATVNVTVNAVNDAPLAADDSLTTNQDTAGSVDVLTNDSDPEGDQLTVTESTNGAHGMVSCTEAGACTYTPAAGFSGSDSFTYTAHDGNGGTDVGTVDVTVTPVVPGNTAPVANDDSLTTDEDVAGMVDVLANDTDADGDTLTVSANSQGAHGTVTCAVESCTYTPAAEFSGSDSFTYTVSDGNGGTDTATVNVTVTQAQQGCTTDELTLKLGGALSGSFSGCIDSGNLRIKSDSLGIKSIKGTAKVASLKGGSGQATVTFDLNRVWIFPAYVGTVTINDPAAGIKTIAYMSFGSISGNAAGASGSLSGLTGSNWWALHPYSLQFKVTDLG